MFDLARYRPTAGMLRALTDAEGATALDYDAARLRGLVDRERMPTSAGREVISRELKRRKREPRTSFHG